VRGNAKTRISRQAVKVNHLRFSILVPGSPITAKCSTRPDCEARGFFFFAVVRLAKVAKHLKGAQTSPDVLSRRSSDNIAKRPSKENVSGTPPKLSTSGLK